MATDEKFIELEDEEEGLGEECACGSNRVLGLENFATDYDKAEFNKGVSDASYWAGFFITLIDGGILPADAITMMTNKMVADHEERMVESNNQAAIKIAETRSDEIEL